MHQPQFSWAEGNDLKLFGCEGKCDGSNTAQDHNNCAPGYVNKGWRFFLFNLTSDRAETTDLWKAQRATAKAMFGRFQAWQVSVLASQGPAENACNPASPPSGPPVPITPVAGMQNAKKRCTSNGTNGIAHVGGGSPEACARQCLKASGEAAITASAEFAAGKAGVPYCGFGRDAGGECKFFSWSGGCNECWLFKECDDVDQSPSWVYTWSTYAMG